MFVAICQINVALGLVYLGLRSWRYQTRFANAITEAIKECGCDTMDVQSQEYASLTSRDPTSPSITIVSPNTWQIFLVTIYRSPGPLPVSIQYGGFTSLRLVQQGKGQGRYPRNHGGIADHFPMVESSWSHYFSCARAGGADCINRIRLDGRKDSPEKNQKRRSVSTPEDERSFRRITGSASCRRRAPDRARRRPGGKSCLSRRMSLLAP